MHRRSPDKIPQGGSFVGRCRAIEIRVEMNRIGTDRSGDEPPRHKIRPLDAPFGEMPLHPFQQGSG
jgi:hypothetical protein